MALQYRRLTVTRPTTRPVSIVGANSLQIPPSVDPEQLLDDLREIARVYAGDTPSSELEFIAQVRPLPPGTRTEQLDQRLDDLLGQDIPDGLGLAVPVALVEYEPFAMTYEIRVHGHRPVYRRELDLRTILERVRNHRAGRRLDALKNSTIALCADQDGRELLDRSVSGHKWITAEIGLGSARMIYHEGKWYEIGERHLEFLRAEIEDILNRQATVVLPPWTADLADEDAYNKEAAKRGYVLLDKQLLKTKQHNRGRASKGATCSGRARRDVVVRLDRDHGARGARPE